MSEEKRALTAKMYLAEVSTHLTQHSPGADAIHQQRVRLNAVYGKGEANKRWSKATPMGSLELTISNPEAFNVLDPGYYKIHIVPCGEND